MKQSLQTLGTVVRWAAITLFVLLGVLGTAFAASGDCISAVIDDPILMPDGSLHPDGKLTICMARDFSPIASLHKMTINKDSIGLVLSRRDRSEGPSQSDSPFIVFYRQTDGSLLLHGYGLPGQDETVTYVLDQPRVGSSAARKNQDPTNTFNTAVLLLAAK